MNYGLTVGEMAYKSGVSRKTVRYYEEIGLLPPPSRDANGYRRYQTEHLNRLAFILRAKNLGLSLEEIHELVSVAENGRCGLTQAELREILERKIADCSRRIEELAALRSSLEEAAARLMPSETSQSEESCPPSAPFAPDCGCVPNVAQPLDLTVWGKV